LWAKFTAVDFHEWACKNDTMVFTGCRRMIMP
jgi:hypothetical protein